MRLWFKVWCETRTRVVIAAAALAVACASLVGWSARWAAAGDAPQTIFLVLATVLGGGSLRQERAGGTLGFTLALPVSRERHLAVRAAVGLVEVAALAALVAILTRSPAVLVSWSACGGLALLVALACAALIANEYAAWLAGFCVVMLHETVLNLVAPDPRFDLYRIMTDPIVGAAMPWPSLAGVVVAGVAVFGLAHIALRREL